VCCGRATGLRAWQDLGFRNVVGVDYSPALVFGNAHSTARVVVGDARKLPLTPFLRLVHFVCERPVVRRFVPRLDALATMIEEERVTYERWLYAPQEHSTVFSHHVVPQFMQRRWGKLIVVGSPVAS
jgi:hypothetical protein